MLWREWSIFLSFMQDSGFILDHTTITENKQIQDCIVFPINKYIPCIANIYRSRKNNKTSIRIPPPGLPPFQDSFDVLQCPLRNPGSFMINVQAPTKLMASFLLSSKELCFFPGFSHLMWLTAWVQFSDVI